MILDLNSKYNQSVPAFKSGSNVVIEVLPWLVDQPWNDLALAYITALRPSCIRFSRGEVFCDARSWRVTIPLDSHDLIVGITQEVQVGLPDGFRIIESIVLLEPSPGGFRNFLKPAPATKPAYQRVLPPRKLNAVAEAVYEYTRLD